jgi:hypothetical protein
MPANARASGSARARARPVYHYPVYWGKWVAPSATSAAARHWSSRGLGTRESVYIGTSNVLRVYKRRRGVGTVADNTRTASPDGSSAVTEPCRIVALGCAQAVSPFSNAHSAPQMNTIDETESAVGARAGNKRSRCRLPEAFQAQISRLALGCRCVGTAGEARSRPQFLNQALASKSRRVLSVPVFK